MLEQKIFRLDNRLMACAEFVRSGKKLADIGTDHAYLPIWLVLQGKVSQAVAADVKEGPLCAAKENIDKYGVSKQITTRLSDGLQEIDAAEAEDIVLAGMGGELIVRILSQAMWLKSEEKQLILQPMTGAKELRIFLREEGFCVKEEKAVSCNDKLYTIMRVVYAPDCRNKEELFPYIGILTAERAENRAYFQKVKSSLEKKQRGLEIRGEKEAAVLRKIIEKIEILLEKRGIDDTRAGNL